MRLGLVTSAATFSILSIGGIADGSIADFALAPFGPGRWALVVRVEGRNEGLSAFSLNMKGTDAEVKATHFEFNPRIKGLHPALDLTPSGFTTQLRGQADNTPSGTGTHYYAGASQPLDDGAIFGVGRQIIDIPNPALPHQDIHFGVPVVLGILTTPVTPERYSPDNPIAVDAGLYGPNRDPLDFLPRSNVSWGPLTVNKPWASFRLTLMGEDPARPGNQRWQLSASVTGSDQYLGLSEFNLILDGPPAELRATDFVFEPRISPTRDDRSAPVGFQTQMTGLVGDSPRYQVSAAQEFDIDKALVDVGKDGRAVLGTLSTPVTLDPCPFPVAGTCGPVSVNARVFTESLLPATSLFFTVIPEPAALALFAGAGMPFLGRRYGSHRLESAPPPCQGTPRRRQ